MTTTARTQRGIALALLFGGSLLLLLAPETPAGLMMLALAIVIELAAALLRHRRPDAPPNPRTQERS